MTGCDPRAALEMTPDYVKSVLGPLGMMDEPLVAIWDGQDRLPLARLMADDEISKILRLVPASAAWVGGDITLGVMADVFIGNPASTFSLFIARSRIALGKDNNYIFRARDDDAEGGWRTSCGDECLYRPPGTAASPYYRPGAASRGSRNAPTILGPRFAPPASEIARVTFEKLRKERMEAMSSNGEEGTKYDNSRGLPADVARAQEEIFRRSYEGLHPEEREMILSRREER